jgi:hypothetical protein
MPLEKSSSDEAFKRNVSTLMGEVGKSPHVQSRQQALAIAYATQRRGHAAGGAPGFAAGGFPSMLPFVERQEARHMAGPLKSSVPGRTDHLPITVGGGAYVLPADHISALGQNNTAAGHKIASSMFSSGPYGTKLPGIKHGSGAPHPPGLPKTPATSNRAFSFKAPKLGSATGGGKMDGGGRGVDILAAGGEHVIPPEEVRRLAQDAKKRHPEWAGHDDLALGHAILDHWVVKRRKEHIKTLKNLPGPAKD